MAEDANQQLYVADLNATGTGAVIQVDPITGAQTVVRTPEHRAALEKVVLSAFSTERPCDRKANRPPGAAALAEAARLLGPEGCDVVVDLARYADLVEGTG